MDGEGGGRGGGRGQLDAATDYSGWGRLRLDGAKNDLIIKIDPMEITPLLAYFTPLLFKISFTL